MSIANTFISLANPILSWVMGCIRGLEDSLTPDDEWVERWRLTVFVTLDPLFTWAGRPLVSEVSDESKICTVGLPEGEVETVVHPQYDRNTASTRKYRIVNGSRQWADGSWAYDPDDEPWQHHIVLFSNLLSDDNSVDASVRSASQTHDGDGITDVYGHLEASIRRPDAHDGGEELVPGDPKRHCRDRLDEHDVSYDT